jgi:lipopolysaccharide export system protein LptC
METRKRDFSGLDRSRAAAQIQQMQAMITRHSRSVLLMKRVLPAIGVLLLIALAVVPNLRTGPAADRVSYRIPTDGQARGAQSRIAQARYRGTDKSGQPYTLTATTAIQQGEGRMALANPEGDISLKSGAWVMLKSANGLYHQKTQILGLDGKVILYRDDGTTMQTAHATINLHTGTADGTDPVAASGPFGTLSAAQGFSMTDRGADVVFHGPATLVLDQVGQLTAPGGGQ